MMIIAIITVIRIVIRGIPIRIGHGIKRISYKVRRPIERNPVMVMVEMMRGLLHGDRRYWLGPASVKSALQNEGNIIT